MSRKQSFKKDQARNSLEIRRPNVSVNLLDELSRSRDRRALHQLDSATHAMNSRNHTDGDLSAGVTAQLKNCVRQQLEGKRPVDLRLFSKRQTGSLRTGFDLQGKRKPTHVDRSHQRKRSAYEQVLQNDRIKRFHTEKVSLNPSEKNIMKKRRLSFGKDSDNLGRSTDLKKMTINVDQRRKPTRSTSQTNHQSLYNRAVDLVTQNKLKQAMHQFQQLIQQDSPFKSGSFLWLSICYKKLGKSDQAIDILNRTLIEFPKHYQGYVYRAKLLTKSKKFQRAKKDLNTAITLQPEKTLAYIAKGDCLRANSQFREAEKAYDLGIRYEKADPSLLYVKKIQMLMDEMRWEEAMRCVEELLGVQPTNSEGLALKGVIQKQKNQLVEAALTFEQSLKHNNSCKGVSRALFELVKLKMQQRDYYQAYYALSRCQHLDVDTSLLQNFRLFNQAAILLMKRKFQQSIKVFDQLQSLSQSFDDFLRPLFHQFKAYGYFCLGRHKQAVRQYNKLDSQKDDISCFNLYLCQGIIEVEKGRYRQGLEFFKRAKEVFPNKVEPYIYTAVSFVREVNDVVRREEKREGATDLEKQRQSAVLKAMDEMNSGNLINDGNSNLLYHRTILSYYFKDFKGGLEDINRCIQKAQDNIPKYFYLRGLGYACTKDLVKAINQFSICTSLDKNYAPAYVQRAKCLFLVGDTDKAFMDLHSYMQLEAKDLSIHKWIGDLLYESKSYSDALKTYCEIEDVGENQEIVLMRARCRARLGMLEEARADMTWLGKHSKKFAKSNKIDVNCLNLLASLSNREAPSKLSTHAKKLNQAMQQDLKGQVFRLVDCMTLIGIAAAYMNKYPDACSSLLLAKQLFQVSQKRNKCQIRSQVSEQHMNLSLKKLNFNLFVMRIAERKFEQAVELARSQLMPLLDSSEREGFYLLLNAYELGETTQKTLLLSKKGEIGGKFQMMEFQVGTVQLKTKMVFGMFHEVCNEMYPFRDACGMIELLTPTYVQDKPQAPWIRRNPYGVVFTQNLLKNESIKLQTTELQKSQHNQAFESFRSEEDRRDDLRHFKEKIKLDESVELKLKKMLKKKKEQQH